MYGEPDTVRLMARGQNPVRRVGGYQHAVAPIERYLPIVHLQLGAPLQHADPFVMGLLRQLRDGVRRTEDAFNGDLLSIQ